MNQEVHLSDIPIEIYTISNGRKGRMVFNEITDFNGKMKIPKSMIPNGKYIIIVNSSESHLYQWDKGSYGPMEIRIIHPFREKYTIICD